MGPYRASSRPMAAFSGLWCSPGHAASDCDVPFIISERVLVQWRRLVAFMKAMDLPHRAMCAIVLAHGHGHHNGQQSGHKLHRCFVLCRPGGCRAILSK